MMKASKSMELEGDTVSECIRVPVVGKSDVIVVGGGASGIVAALAAARNGADTMLIEQSSFLGGELTQGYQLNFGQPSFASSRKQLIRGITGEIVEHMVRMGGFLRTDGSSPFDPELIKYLALKLLLKAGVNVRLYTAFSDAIVEKNTICGIITESKAGRQAFLAERIVDCSGDADVAARAGVPFEIGRKKDHHVQPMNMTFLLGGVDVDTVIAYVKDHPDQFGTGLNRTILEEGVRPAVRVTGFFDITRKYAKDYGLKVLYTRFGTVPVGDGKRIVYVNMARAIHYNPLDPDDKTKADFMLREQVFKIHNFLRNHIPGFTASYIISTSPWVATRESRRIIGEYVLDAEEILAGKTFHDAVFRSAIAFAGSGHPHPVDGDEGGPGSTYEYAEKEWHEYEVPYGVSVPKKIDNLLVAGRCRSVTHSGLGLAKSVPVCMAEAQSAGTAAALSIRAGVSPRHLDVKTLQTQLLKDGVYLPNVEIKLSSDSGTACKR
jgi:hypothetical protein